jgi:acetylornithine deacetylase/succinyl-diaminopimelate desuccinylase-like protein
MEGRKAELLQRIESNREVLLDFLRGFIRCPSPNPPGDTREAADHPADYWRSMASNVG